MLNSEAELTGGCGWLEGHRGGRGCGWGGRGCGGAVSDHVQHRAGEGRVGSRRLIGRTRKARRGQGRGSGAVSGGGIQSVPPLLDGGGGRGWDHDSFSAKDMDMSEQSDLDVQIICVHSPQRCSQGSQGGGVKQGAGSQGAGSQGWRGGPEDDRDGPRPI